MNDGKVLSHVYDVPFSRCYICYCPPTFMNKFDKWLEHADYNMDHDALSHSIAPLHTNMRVFLHLFNLACKENVPKDKSQARGAEIKQLVANKKKFLQDEFISKMNLRVEFPTPEGGTSTTGGTAKRAFDDPELLATILGLDKVMVKTLGLLLAAIRSFRKINVDEFEKKCNVVKQIYIRDHSNIPMNTKMHQLLEHGPDILRTCVLPPGFTSEEGAEALNKFLRRDRINHARKDSRTHNLLDVFHRRLAMSDPKISKVGMKRRQKMKQKKIDPELQKLFDDQNEYDDDFVSSDEPLESQVESSQE